MIHLVHDANSNKEQATNDKKELPDEVLQAFHLMWGTFPEPVSLVRRDRRVMAVNRVHPLTPGAICSQSGGPGAHQGCRAKEALDRQEPIYSLFDAMGREGVGYWLPLEGYPDFFLHFSVGYIDYRKQNSGYLNIGNLGN